MSYSIADANEFVEFRVGQDKCVLLLDLPDDLLTVLFDFRESDAPRETLS